MFFFGRHEHQLDDKNRLRIPSKFRKDLLGDDEKPYYFFRGRDGCIGVMSSDTMEKTFFPMAEGYFGEMSNIKRAALSSICAAEEDAQGRVVLPLSLRNIAGIKKDVVTIGVGNYIEIWAAERLSDQLGLVDYDAEVGDLKGKR